MSALTHHAQHHLSDLDPGATEATVLDRTSPVLATPAAFAAGAGVAVTAGVAGFVAEEAMDE